MDLAVLALGIYKSQRQSLDSYCATGIKVMYTSTTYMKRININHLRAIKKFSKSDKKIKISDYEKFLIDYVSIPTARKIIKELIELNIVSVIKSELDLRVKYLVINNTDIEKYL